MNKEEYKITANPSFLIRLCRIVCGLLLMPFLYARYSFVFFLPIFFMDNVVNVAFVMVWSIYLIVFCFIMGNCGVMHYWTKLFKWIFSVKYEISSSWSHDAHYSYCVWSHPILKARNKEHKLTIAVAGGNSYDKEDIIRRKSIIYWLLEK